MSRGLETVFWESSQFRSPFRRIARVDCFNETPKIQDKSLFREISRDALENNVFIIFVV